MTTKLYKNIKNKTNTKLKISKLYSLSSDWVSKNKYKIEIDLIVNSVTKLSAIIVIYKHCWYVSFYATHPTTEAFYNQIPNTLKYNNIRMIFTMNILSFELVVSSKHFCQYKHGVKLRVIIQHWQLVI